VAEREPGWYPHPLYPEDERWWDGEAWGPSRPGGHRAVTHLSSHVRPTPRRSLTAVLLILAAMVAAYFGLWWLASSTSDPNEPFGVSAPVVAVLGSPYG
jgi:hypothetical protein